MDSHKMTAVVVGAVTAALVALSTAMNVRVMFFLSRKRVPFAFSKSGMPGYLDRIYADSGPEVRTPSMDSFVRVHRAVTILTMLAAMAFFVVMGFQPRRARPEPGRLGGTPDGGTLSGSASSTGAEAVPTSSTTGLRPEEP